MADIEIRPVRQGDYEALYGQPQRHSIRGWTATVDGEPMGMAGVVYVGNQVQAFSKSLPGLPKRWVAKGAALTRRMLRELNCHVLAVADPQIPTAPAFLKRVGFEHVTTNSQGEVYRWTR